MRRYDVVVDCHYTKVVSVTACSAKDAKEHVKHLYDTCGIKIDKLDHVTFSSGGPKRIHENSDA